MPSVPPSYIDATAEHDIQTLCSPPKLQKYRFVERKSRSILWSLATVGLFLGLLIFFLFSREKIENFDHFVSLKGSSPDFIGRKKVLEELCKQLTNPSAEEFQQSAKIKVLWGKGGFGKSETAIQFGNLYQSHFSFIWTLLCDSQEHLEQGYRDLAEKLGILNPKESPQKTKEKVHLFLENHTFKLPYLLIYDNVEDDTIDYPQRGGAILITSQKKVLNPEYLIEVPVFSHEESIALLEKITQECRSEAMVQLAKDLDGIPLLVNSAAHYIKATPGCSVADYHTLFTTCCQEKYGPLWQHTDVNKRYCKSLAASWLFPLKSLERDNPLALQWLYLCGYLYRESIPEDWITDWLVGRTDLSLEIVKKEILKSLQAYGLIRYEGDSKTFSLHPFFQQILRENRKNEIDTDLAQAVDLLIKHGKDYHFLQMSTWRQGWLYYLHASEIRRHLNHLSNQIESVKKATIIETIGFWGLYNHRFLDSLDALKEALVLRQSNDMSLEIGAIYQSMSWDLFKLGRYSEGLEYCKKAAVIQELHFDKAPLHITHTLNTQGLILYEMGEYEACLQCHEKALAIRKQQGGDKFFGCSLHNIAICLGKMGRHQEALDLFEQVHVLDQKFLGKDHPLSLYTFVCKGDTFADQRDFKKALNLLQKIERKYPKEHADLAPLWNGMGRCYLELREYKKAKTFFKKALHLAEHYFGKNNPSVVTAYQGIGWSYIKTNNFKKGLKFLSDAREIGDLLYADAPRKKCQISDSFNSALEQEKCVGSKKVCFRF